MTTRGPQRGPHLPRQPAEEGLQRVDVVLIENHEIARRGLHEMLHSLPFVQRARSFESPGMAARAPQDGSPDIVIIPSDVDEAGVQELLAGQGAEAKILVLLRSGDPGEVCPALRGRISGFLIEPEVTVEELARALVRAASGETVLPHELAEHLLWAPPRRSGGSPPYLFTPRERQVLELLGEGLSNKQIARRLSISEHGAKRHVAMVLAKLNCPNRTLAVAKAIREGLLAASA